MRRILLLLALSASGLGCPSSPPPAARPVLSLSRGDGQAARVGQPLPLSLEVYVATTAGEPVASRAVRFTADPAQVRLSASEVSTGLDGFARVQATLLGAPGPREVLAEADEADGSPVRFSALALPGLAERLELVGGDGQQALTRAELPLALTVRALDAFGNAVPLASVVWSARLGAGEVAPAQASTDAQGLATARATLGASQGEYRFAATLETGASVDFAARTLPTGLWYDDPPPGGKLRLVRRATSSPQRLILDLIAAAPLAGYSAGLQLPIDAGRVRLAGPLVPGAGLEPGSGPKVALATIPTQGPNAGQLLAAVSQKASGAGARPDDASLRPGAVLLTLELEAVPGASLGPALAASGVQGGLRDKLGTDTVLAKDIAVGKLETR